MKFKNLSIPRKIGPINLIEINIIILIHIIIHMYIFYFKFNLFNFKIFIKKYNDYCEFKF